MVTGRAVSLWPDRRTFLTAAGMMLAAGLPLRAASVRPRLAAIDWAMLETAIAIGHMPVAACELIRFRADAVEPVVPDDVVDLGLRGSPNYELLQLTRPDLILSSPYYTHYEERLKALAPVLSLPFYTPGEAPLPKALAALEALAEAVDDPQAGKQARREAEATLDRHAKELAGFTDRPVCLVNIGDARHLRAFGFDSLFGSTLARLGLRNAWSEGTKFSFMAPVPIERLATMPEARLVIIGKIPAEAQRGLSRSVLWEALSPVSQRRLYRLPDMNAFGGIPSALRFARQLEQAFRDGPAPGI
ncbi:ABC transporter substrate-binding protein [Paracoccus alkanivorans]|uniref:Iron-siderophore ABC transporter substrate-binding protein n=1 Tax=Paracoccus alkanivorans TaxID=2116655 RepID=A0A3M0MIX1_9RHOB|nr:ABC transporter substrate-binding protein [Paracoccus alkanivorans]RMC37551.1 iron-siderophore ABC transporter substrate-binding protein [Paracoccus alkanivorans]